MSSSLSYAMKTNHFLIWLWCVTKSGFYMTTGNNQLSDGPRRNYQGSHKKLQSTSQSQTQTKTKSWPLFAGLLQVWLTTAFWILAKSVHLRGMQIHETHQKPLPKASICQKKGPNFSAQQHPTSQSTSNTSKVEQIRLQNFASSAIFTWPLINWRHFFKQLNKFLKDKCFHNQQEGENAFQEFVKSQSIDFYVTRINKHFSLKKMCWLQ